MLKKMSASCLIILAAIALMIAIRPVVKASEPSIVGTWSVTIPGPDGFEALQTFNADGTFVETSSLLGQRQEGPAHGVWQQEDDHYLLTFYLFTFDKDSGSSAGMVRVRMKITLDSADHWIGAGYVDIYDVDGKLVDANLGGDGEPNQATRVKVETVDKITP